MFFGTQEPTRETKHLFKKIEVDNADRNAQTCKASEFGETQAALTNKCFCENIGFMQILVDYEDGSGADLYHSIDKVDLLLTNSQYNVVSEVPLVTSTDGSGITFMLLDENLDELVLDDLLDYDSNND